MVETALSVITYYFFFEIFCLFYYVYAGASRLKMSVFVLLSSMVTICSDWRWTWSWIVYVVKVDFSTQGLLDSYLYYWYASQYVFICISISFLQAQNFPLYSWKFQQKDLIWVRFLWNRWFLWKYSYVIM